MVYSSLLATESGGAGRGPESGKSTARTTQARGELAAVSIRKGNDGQQEPRGEGARNRKKAIFFRTQHAVAADLDKEGRGVAKLNEARLSAETQTFP